MKNFANLTILVSGCALASSAYMTRPLPGSERPDGTSRALSHSEMDSARGAGSVCRLGCNEPNLACHEVALTGTYRTLTWYPHNECGFSWGPDTCTPQIDVQCYIDISWIDDECTIQDGNSQVTMTSTCKMPVQPPE